MVGTPGQPNDPPPQFFPHAGSQVAYTDEGGGQATVVAVPGVPGAGRDFRWLAPFLSDRLRVVRIDPPGFGCSARPRTVGMSISDRAEVARAVIVRLGIGPVVLVGHSAGAGVVAHVSRHHPELVRSNVLLSPIGPRPSSSRVVLHVGARLLRVPGGQHVLAHALRRGFAAQGFSPHLTDRQRALAILDAAAFDFAEYRANLVGMNRPTLVAWAHDDGVIPAEAFRAVENLVPAGPRLVFDSGGHNVQKARAREIGEAIVEFAEG